VFPVRGGVHLHPSSIEYVVAMRADVEAKVSPHWLRRSNATHALERDVPIHLVASVATIDCYLRASDG
jgi:site-specific recombinase XerD